MAKDERPVVKKNDKYWFGNLQVTSPDPITRIFLYTTITDSCWLWNGRKSRNGYGVTKHNGKNRPVHRFLWETFYGPIDKDIVCCHKCDVRNCINPAHIFLGTRSDNQRDMKEKGRAAKGSKNGYSKLTEADIVTIRQLHKEGFYQREIAKLYGMSQHVIGKVINRVTWRHVE